MSAAAVRSEWQELAQHAINAKENAYCPYSNFRVGCAILTERGSIVTGVNVENASFPVGTCAERCAAARAVAEGHRRFIALAVATDISPPASPCGMCRQFIREFAPLSLPIIMLDKDGNAITKTLNDLLPLSFGPEHLPPTTQGVARTAEVYW